MWWWLVSAALAEGVDPVERSTVCVTPNALSVHAAPDAATQVVARLPRGDRLQRTGEVADGGAWSRVRVGRAEGWALEEQLTTACVDEDLDGDGQAERVVLVPAASGSWLWARDGADGQAHRVLLPLWAANVSLRVHHAASGDVRLVEVLDVVDGCCGYVQRSWVSYRRDEAGLPKLRVALVATEQYGEGEGWREDSVVLDQDLSRATRWQVVWTSDDQRDRAVVTRTAYVLEEGVFVAVGEPLRLRGSVATGVE